MGAGGGGERGAARPSPRPQGAVGDEGHVRAEVAGVLPAFRCLRFTPSRKTQAQAKNLLDRGPQLRKGFLVRVAVVNTSLRDVLYTAHTSPGTPGVPRAFHRDWSRPCVGLEGWRAGEVGGARPGPCEQGAWSLPRGEGAKHGPGRRAQQAWGAPLAAGGDGDGGGWTLGTCLALSPRVASRWVRASSSARARRASLLAACSRGVRSVFHEQKQAPARPAASRPGPLCWPGASGCRVVTHSKPSD